MDRRDDLVALTEQCRTLAGQVRDLHNAAGVRIRKLDKHAQTNRKMIMMVSVALVLELIIMVGILLSGVQLQHQGNEIEKVQRRTSNEILCPLYQQFLRAEKSPAPPNYTAEQRQTRTEGFKVIRESYDKLDCPKTQAR